jgi:hypothetical protein
MTECDRREFALGKSTSAEQERPNSASGVRLVAFLLLVPSDAEPLVSLLEQIAAAAQNPVAMHSTPGLAPSAPEAGCDRWVEHAEAAKRLGIAKSTLYRYASQSSIEYRKYGGRLQYRESALLKHEQAQIRPARFPLANGGIIRTALSSGK